MHKTMKSSLCSIQLLALASYTVAASSGSNSLFGSPSSAAMKKILSKARRLEDAGGENGENQDGGQDGAKMEAFLMDYSMKLMKCIPDQVLTDADYNDHFGVVIFRLCPSNSCNDQSGCTSGYADFAVDIGTYVEAYMKDQQDNMQWDDQFDGEMFGQCVEYEDDENGATGFYIGPTCTADGTGVRMAVFEDKYCYGVSDTSFETISNGWALPFTGGGLVSTWCSSCVDNDGALRDMCLGLYENSQYRCEGDFDFEHYYYDNNFEIYRYGKDQTGCNKIEVMQATKQSMQGAVWQDLIISVMLLITAAGGFALYSVWWRKQKENLERIDDEDDDDESGYHQHDEDHDDGEIVQHPDAGYQGMQDSPAPADGTLA